MISPVVAKLEEQGSCKHRNQHLWEQRLKFQNSYIPPNPLGVVSLKGAEKIGVEEFYYSHLSPKTLEVLSLQANYSRVNREFLYFAPIVILQFILIFCRMFLKCYPSSKPNNCVMNGAEQVAKLAI